MSTFVLINNDICYRHSSHGKHDREPDIKRPGKVKIKAVGSAVSFLNYVNNRFEKQFPQTYSLLKRLKDGMTEILLTL